MRAIIPAALSATLLAALVPLSASADDNADTLHGFIGGGVGVKPAYSGAKDNKLSFVPALKVEYGSFFVGGVDTLTAAGWKFYDTDRWQFSLGVGSDLFPREESDDDHLKGMGDISVTPRAFVSGTYKNGFFTGGAILTQDIGGNDQGFRFTTYAHAEWQATDDLRLFAGPSVSWADSDYMQTQYGVSSAQSTRSGLQRYDAGSGLEQVGLELGADYQINRSWMVGFRTFASHLEDHASDSPVVEDADQLRYALFLAWKF